MIRYQDNAIFIGGEMSGAKTACSPVSAQGEGSASKPTRQAQCGTFGLT